MRIGPDLSPPEEMDIWDEIDEERARQQKWGSDDFDKSNTRNDWIAYITSYAGDAKFSFYRDWACYEWTVSVGKYHSRFLPMRGGSVWEREDGHRACWRWMGGA